LRVYISFRERAKLSLSIWPIIFSVLGQIVFSSVSTWSADSYVNTATVDIQAIYAMSFLLYFNIYILKASFVILYYENFHATVKTRPWLRWSLYLTTAYCLSALIATTLLNAFVCSPPLSDGCTPMFNTGNFLVATILNVSSDLLLLGFPFSLLRLCSRADRTGFSIILLLALTSIAIALLRLLLFWNSAEQAYQTNKDQVGFVAFAMWSVIELSIGTVAACLPGFRAWWVRVLGSKGTRRRAMDIGASEELRSRGSQSENGDFLVK